MRRSLRPRAILADDSSLQPEGAARDEHLGSPPQSPQQPVSGRRAILSGTRRRGTLQQPIPDSSSDDDAEEPFPDPPHNVRIFGISF